MTYCGVLLRADGTPQARRIASLIGLRDAARRVLQSQNEGWPRPNRDAERAALRLAYDRFVSSALKAASVLEQTRSAPQQAWLAQTARSLRMWVSVMESVRNFVAGQSIRDAHRQELSAAPPASFKETGGGGDPDYFAWYPIERRELDNTAELIRLLNDGGLSYLAHARKAEDEDTFLLGPNLLQTLEMKRQMMRKHWLDAQQYIASPNR